MSETMTSAEIEDVLSSIRRLVSDELRVPAGMGQPSVPDKLILTAAQRVDADIPPVQLVPAPPVASEADEDLGPIVGLAGRFAALRAVVAERRLAPVDTDSTAADEETSAAVTSRDKASAEVPEADIWIEGEGDDWVEDWAEPETAEFIAFPTPVASAVSEIAEVVVLQQPEAARPAAAIEPEDVTEVSGAELSLVEEEPAPPTEEGDDVGQGVLLLDAPVFVAAGAEFTAAAPVALPPEDETDLDDDDRFIAELDEDQLRVLVRGMIRNELQGELGERITRNIRKMLRAEIARALSVHGIT